MKRTIFWPQASRSFKLKELLEELEQKGLNPETTTISIDVDQDTSGMVTNVKLHCEDL